MISSFLREGFEGVAFGCAVACFTPVPLTTSLAYFVVAKVAATALAHFIHYFQKPEATKRKNEDKLSSLLACSNILVLSGAHIKEWIPLQGAACLIIIDFVVRIFAYDIERGLKACGRFIAARLG